MTMGWLRRLGGLGIASLTGCAAIGPAVGGIGSLVQLALSLALMALPFAAAYYFYKKD